MSFLAAAVQVNGIALHDHFNHNELYHVIQMGGMYLFYRGARVLKDRSRSRPFSLWAPVGPPIP